MNNLAHILAEIRLTDVLPAELIIETAPSAERMQKKGYTYQNKSACKGFSLVPTPDKIDNQPSKMT